MLWIGAGLIGLFSVAPGIERIAAEAPATEPAAGERAIPRSPDGQFYVDGQVNGVAVRFLVDPEADKVLIAGPDAERLGLPPRGALTLDSLTVGPAQQRQVAAQIAPAMPVSLLGRAYLSRLQAAGVRGDRLILR